MEIQVFFLVFVSVIAKSSAAVAQVINGTEAVPHSHPWLLTLTKIENEEEVAHCGASLLYVPYLNDSSDIAVTAAHCISRFRSCSQKDFKKFAVIASNHSLTYAEENQTRRLVVSGNCHENWTRVRGPFNDIALLKLDKPLPFTETVRPIALPKMGEAVEANTNCTVAGWGLTGLSSTDRATVLHELRVRILNDSECHKGESRICAVSASNNGHPYHGDSGSALVCQEGLTQVLEGIVSGPGGYVFGKLSAVHTRVSYFVDWITDQIKVLSSK